MASIYHGRGAALGFGEETTGNYGVAVSPTVWRPAISTSLLRTVEKVPRPTLRTGAAGAMRRAHFVQADNAGGSFQIEATYENCGMILKHALGKVTTTGGGPYTHTYTLSDHVTTDKPGLSIANVRGTGTTEVFEGSRINTFTFAVSSGSVATIDCAVISETTNGRVSTTHTDSDFAGTETPVLHHQAGTLSFNSVNYPLIDMSLVVNNSLATRQKLGSSLTLQPLRSDFQSVEMSVTVEVDDALALALTADTVSDATIVFSSGAGTFTVNVHNAYLSEVSDPISDANIVRQSITLVGQSDGSDEGCSIVVVNDDATGIGN